MKSNRFLQGSKGVGAVWILAALMLFSLGCSKLLPTAPGTADSSDHLWSASSEADSLTSDWSEVCSLEDGRWIGSVGGVINQVIDTEHLLFRVPPQALQDSAYITVKTTLLGRLVDQDEQYKLEFEFTPDGLVFASPANLTFQTRTIGADPGDFLTLRWLNPSTGRWEVQQVVKVNVALVQVNFYIHHFSRYAIGCSSSPPQGL